MIALVIVAVSLGLSNFPAAVGIGMEGVTRRHRAEVLVAFGVFETGMPIVGLVVGHLSAAHLGGAARTVGGAVLLAIGCYSLLERRGARPSSHRAAESRARLVLIALALSLDNLAVGFAIGTVHVAFVVAVAVIGAVSVAMSALGLEIGTRLGARLAGRAQVVGGVLLSGVGIALLAGAA